jgi:hypothetical protein
MEGNDPKESGQEPRRDYIGGGWSGDWGPAMAPALGPTYPMNREAAERYGHGGNAPYPHPREHGEARGHEPGLVERARQWFGGDVGESRSEARAGRPPRNYQRSDQRILDELCEGIVASGIDASGVDVFVERRIVRLSGSVAHKDDRRRIEDLAEDILGVDMVESHLRVVRMAPSQAGTQVGTQPGTQDPASAARTQPPTAQTTTGQPQSAPGARTTGLPPRR